MAQTDAHLTGAQEVAGLVLARSGSILFVEIDRGD